MSDYILVQEKEMGLGQISISNAVVTSIIKNVVDSVDHVYLEEARSLKSTPLVKFEAGNVHINLRVRVKYGQNVESSCLALQKELQQQLELMVDYRDPIINMNVVGFRFN